MKKVIAKIKKIVSVLLVIITIALILPIALPIGENVKTADAATVIKIDKTKATIVVSKTLQLKINGTNKKVLWTSNNKAVVTVTSKGKVLAKTVGTATITATIGKSKYSCKVTVKKAPILVTNILTTCKFLITPINSVFYFNATPYPNTAGKKTLEWKSSDDTIVQVDESGVCLTIKEGMAEIYAYSTDGSNVFAKWDITVSNDFSLRVSTDEKEINLTYGETKMIYLKVSGLADTENINYYTSNANITAFCGIMTNWKIPVTIYANEIGTTNLVFTSSLYPEEYIVTVNVVQSSVKLDDGN